LSLLILVRHGKSLWNKENRFTGWTDIKLSEDGILEAKNAAKEIKSKNISINLAFSSIFKRANETGKIILENLDKVNLIVQKDWRLNERHYGSLQGLNKEETKKKFGANQVLKWRRSFDAKPPLLSNEEFQEQKTNPLFKTIPIDKLSNGESLKDTLVRVKEFCDEILFQELKKDGNNILIAAHGNSIRAMIKLIENIPDDSIDKLEIETGKPMFYKYKNNIFTK